MNNSGFLFWIQLRKNRITAYRNLIQFHKDWHKEEGADIKDIYTRLIQLSPIRAKKMWDLYIAMIGASRDFVRGKKDFDTWRDTVELWSVSVLDANAVLNNKNVYL